MKAQAITNKTKVQFNLKGFKSEFLEMEETADYVKYDNKIGTVLCRATFTEPGEKDFEYYDVKFDDGFVMEAVSGYHLTIK